MKKGCNEIPMLQSFYSSSFITEGILVLSWTIVLAFLMLIQFVLSHQLTYLVYDSGALLSRSVDKLYIQVQCHRIIWYFNVASTLSLNVNSLNVCMFLNWSFKLVLYIIWFFSVKCMTKFVSMNFIACMYRIMLMSCNWIFFFFIFGGGRGSSLFLIMISSS